MTLRTSEITPASLEGAVCAFGWQAENRELNGDSWAVLTRRDPVSLEQKPRVTPSVLETDRRKLVVGGSVLAFVARLPLQGDDVAAISRVEGALLYAQPSVEDSDKAMDFIDDRRSYGLFDEITNKQEAVVKRILLPESEIAEQLGVSALSVADRLKTVQRKYFESKTELVVHALSEGVVDMSQVSQVSTLDLSEELQDYIRGEGFYARESSRKWWTICVRTGARTKYEVYAMAIRDGIVDVQSLIEAHSSVRQR